MRFGFLGAGRIATMALAPAVHAASGAELVAAAARDPARAANLEPTGRAYGSYQALLEDDSVEVVYCALANDAHMPWVIAAMEAGKHVLCEKPLGRDAAEVRSMAAVADATDRLLVEAFWYRWHPRIREAERIVASGELGQTVAVDASFTFRGVARGDYRLDPLKGGGALLDVGCYAASALLWGNGYAELEVVDVQARWASSGVDMATTACFLPPYRRGRAAGGYRPSRLHCSFDEPEQQWLAVEGERASLELPDMPFTAWREDRTTLVIVDSSDGHRFSRTFATADPYRLMVEALSARVRGVESPSQGAWVMPLEQSLAVAGLLDAVRKGLGWSGPASGPGLSAP